MQITKWNWRDAGIMYEAEAGGTGSGEPVKEEPVTSPVVEMTTEQLKVELERTRAALKSANKEAGDRRKKLDEIEANEAKRKEAELTETQKAAKRAEDAENLLKTTQARYKTNAIHNAVRLAALKAGFADSDDAVALADLSEINVDENDKVTGAELAVKALAEKKPHLLVKATGAPNINSNQGGAPQPLTIEGLVQQRRETDRMYVPF